MIAGGIAIVLALLPVVGYNSLAQSFPKAALDGAVLLLLMGQRTRWRYLALLGVVVGLFLGFVMPAYPHLLAVLALTGGAAAGVGYGLEKLRIGRTAAVLLAAMTFELITSVGKPLQIWLGAGDAGGMTILWSMYFAEWPLRIAGVAVGVALMRRTLQRWDAESETADAGTLQNFHSPPLAHKHGQARTRRRIAAGRRRAGLCALLAIAACTLPMIAQTWAQLSVIALAYIVMTLLLGLGRSAVHAIVGVTWGWLIFAAAAYLWTGDAWRTVDLLRTFWLRFLPMTLCAMLVMATIRPVEMFRLFRWARLPGVVLLPWAQVLRMLPHLRRELRGEVARLKATGVWTNRWSVFRRPRAIGGALFNCSLVQLARELRES